MASIALTVRWNALLDRGVEETLAGATAPTRVDQGGADIVAFGRKDLSKNTRIAGSVEYLSSYIYRLAFDENLAQATSSEVQSNAALTHNHRGFIPSVSLDRFQSFAGSSTTDGEPSRQRPRSPHPPPAQRPLRRSRETFPRHLSQAAASLLEPRLLHRRPSTAPSPTSTPATSAAWTSTPTSNGPCTSATGKSAPELALRSTQYSGSQTPDLTGANFGGVPFVQHNPLNRRDIEASLDIRPPVLERDFTVNRWNRQFRHVIEPEIFYRYVTGINNARNTLHFDTTDIATNTNEAGFSLTQRLYLRPIHTKPCEETLQEPESKNPKHERTQSNPTGLSDPSDPCKPKPREWASWQITQKYFIDSTFGGALIPDRRNVFDSTLDLTGIAYLTSPRNISPVISRLRFEAIDPPPPGMGPRLRHQSRPTRLRQPLRRLQLRNAPPPASTPPCSTPPTKNGSTATIIQSHQVQPFLFFGKPSDAGLSAALNASYDFTHGALQYGGIEAIYNWNCCGLNVGYRRFALGSLRDESEWLWGFTLSGIGTAGNIRRSTSVFPTPEALSRMY